MIEPGNEIWVSEKNDFEKLCRQFVTIKPTPYSPHNFTHIFTLVSTFITHHGSHVRKGVGWIVLGWLELTFANSLVEREFRLLASPTRELLLPGARPPRRRLSPPSAVWLRRVWLLPRSVFSWEIRRELVRSRPWLVPRSSDFLRRTVRFRLSVSWQFRTCSFSSRGYVFPDQEGCCHPQASWA